MTNSRPSHHDSSTLEKVLEHRLIAEMTSCLWRSGSREFEVLHSEVDSGGYDIVVEARGVLRHIQLKHMVRGGKRREVPVNRRLAAKNSGCVIWYDYDPDTLELGPFRWFGTLPGLGLPSLGDEVATHTRGSKNPRPAHRKLRKSRFLQVSTMEELISILFGRERAEELDLLRRHIATQPEPHGEGPLKRVWEGDFTAIPPELDWDTSVELAHLVDGYELSEMLGLGDPREFVERQFEHAHEQGVWLGSAVILWTTLFLEHRRWRMSPMEPSAGVRTSLARLCRQLVGAVSG